VVLSNEVVQFDDLCPNDPQLLDYVSMEDLGLGYAKAELVGNSPPSMLKDEPYVVNEGSMSGYCRFTRELLSFPPLGGVEYDLDLGVKFSNGPLDGVHYEIILYADCTI